MADGLTQTPEVDLSIVMVNWNSAEYVLACVQSIVTETMATRYEVLVVDNASFDGCEALLKSQCPHVIFVQSDRNLGFGGANNLGARRARGNVLLFLNPDTVVRNRALDRLYDRFRGIPDVGIAGCTLLNTDGSLQTSCVQAMPTVLNQLLDADVLRRLAPKASLWGNRALYSDSGGPVRVEAISGACMMVRREVFDHVGGFSPAFFMYGEDLDLCARINRAGFNNMYIPDCEVLHHGGGSARKAPSAFSVIMMCESVSLLLRRLRGPMVSAGYRAAMTMAAALRLVILIVSWPWWLVTRRAAFWTDACHKWTTVLGWGLGLNRRSMLAPGATPARART